MTNPFETTLPGSPELSPDRRGIIASPATRWPAVERLIRKLCRRCIQIEIAGVRYVMKPGPDGLNEALATAVLAAAGVPVPPFSLVMYRSESARHECLGLPLIPEGVHFASQYPLDPLVFPLFDYMPSAILEPWQADVRALVGGYIAGVWLARTEPSQWVYARCQTDRLRRWLPYLIDHHSSFGGDTWGFECSAFPCYLPTELIVAYIDQYADEWCDQVLESAPFWLDALSLACANLPGEWKARAPGPIETLGQELIRRAEGLANLVSEARRYLVRADLERRRELLETRKKPPSSAFTDRETRRINDRKCLLKR